MYVLLSLSLGLAVMMSSCCGDAGSHEEETTGDYNDYWTVTVTPDYNYYYDYNATFDYSIVMGPSSSDVSGKAAGIGRISPALLLGLAVHQIWN